MPPTSSDNLFDIKNAPIHDFCGWVRFSNAIRERETANENGYVK
nr:MAG TPA: hypothetical protein [Caudoviricetes sp.]